ncbi:CPBP family intramembrane glutamic endopeptidase [Micromonospora sp. CPCC 206061]|uniref:CPBP family intramembrane glutamic endopeptidase n=1 Tax=Micromonospora sp. CPCC 206061 TaxID=3122410 RepID=UPI002FEF36D8
MTSPPLPGTPYHRLARTDRHRWWRPIVGTVAFLGAYIFILVAVGCVVLVFTEAAGLPAGADGLPDVGPIAGTAALLLSLAILTPLLFLAAWLIQRRPPGTLVSVTGRLRLRWLGTCMGVALFFVLVLIGVGTLIGDDVAPAAATWVGWPEFLLAALMLVLLVPLQASAEEFLFRGWLLQAIGSYLRGPLVPIALQAVLFGAAHGWGTPWGFAALAVFGAATGWLTVRTGGLEAGIALHVLTNLLAFLVAAALGGLDTDETLADAPGYLAVLDMAVVCGFAAVVLLLARRRGLTDAVPDPSPWPPRPAPPPPAYAGLPYGWPAPPPANWPAPPRQGAAQPAAPGAVAPPAPPGVSSEEPAP